MSHKIFNLPKNINEFARHSERLDSCFLAEFALNNARNIIYIASEKIELEQLKSQIEFFGISHDIILLESWDCLPYDRVSPSRVVINNRIKALFDLMEGDRPKLLLTYTNNIAQRLPPKKVLKSASLRLKRGDKFKTGDLCDFLITNGFTRSPSANSAGEFAVRGGIIDIITSSEETGYRIDYFGDNIDKIRSFDPLTQLSGSVVNSCEILPSSEIIFQDEYIESFKTKYRQLVGVKASNDPLYEAISNKRKFPAMENWMPLFYDSLSTIFDYIENPIIIKTSFFEQDLETRQDEIEEYYEARVQNLKSKIKEQEFYPLRANELYIDDFANVAQNYEKVTLLHENENEFFKKVPSFITNAVLNSVSVITEFKNFIDSSGKRKDGSFKKYKTLVTCFSSGTLDRMKSILEQHEIHFVEINKFDELKEIKGKTIALTIANFDQGFITDDIIIVSEQDLFGERVNRAIKKKRKLEHFLNESASFAEGEAVVHKDHGIGAFGGIETIVVNNIPHDCFKLVYDGGDRLFVPVENAELISKYGSDEGVRLDKLGGAGWQARTAKLKNRIKLAAEVLIKIAAEREVRSGAVIVPPTEIYSEFVTKFPYVETEDQLNAEQDIKQDLESGKPMDRLICGDVGFGKTEVAIRAAFMATSTGEKNQVAVVVPTTLLARQHFKTFTERLKGFNVRVKQISRMVTAKEASLVKEGLKNGDVDIVIGTHALLSNNIQFNNLKLVIIDEEQHFGVAQKEQLKKLKSDVHVLTLSATPIPRTLQMSLVGVKELSLIATPPVDRIAVKTYVMPYDSVVIREAILREYYRGGKCFYVAARISELDEIYDRLKALVPEVKVVIAHGQMSATQLDEIMNDFYDSKFDVLLSTTIVESGLDIPSANTIIIHNADRFGLAQLYQLRGRVGRGKIKGYAYLTVNSNKTNSKDAMKKLDIMQTLDSLGAGFSISSHDMDIRGFGNLVGDEQSGHIREVGVELYQEMLKEAVANLMHEKQHEKEEPAKVSTQINLGLPVLIPEDYISDLSLRLNIYRRAANLESVEEVELFKAEMIDRFGKMPPEFENLLKIVLLKIIALKLHIVKIDAGNKGIAISFQEKVEYPKILNNYIAKNINRIKLKPDNKLILTYESEDPMKRYKFLYGELSSLV